MTEKKQRKSKKATATTAKKPGKAAPEVPKSDESPSFVSRRAKLPAKKRSTSLAPTDPLLQAYLREIQKYPLLTKEEERELALKYYKTGDREALHQLVTSNLRFVVKIAFEYVHYRLKLLDLIQEGNTGLVKAVQDYDPYKEVRLTTYAVWWIRSYIQDAILKNYSLVKMGTTQAQKRLFYRLRKEQKKLEQMGLTPENKVKLLASRLDVREKDVEEMDQRLSQGDLSLNAPVGPDEKKDHLQSLTDEQQSADVSLGEAEQRELFQRMLRQFASTLEGREKVIFEQRLISESPLTLQEIGDKYGVSKERARQLEEQIKDKLKKYVEAHYPDFNLLTGAL